MWSQGWSLANLIAKYMRNLFWLLATILVLKIFFPDLISVLEQTALDAMQYLQKIVAAQTGGF